MPWRGDRDDVDRWIARYEQAWRSPHLEELNEVFPERVAYVKSPWSEPILGLAQLGRFWEHARTGPDEDFRMTSSIVAVEGRTAVVRVAVDYGSGERWRDLWVLTFDDEGRCEAFEEWPFGPG